MTKLQKIRKTLMEQLDKLEKGECDTDVLELTLGVSDAVTKSYNTELRAKELELNAEGSHLKLDDIDVFKKDL